MEKYKNVKLSYEENKKMNELIIDYHTNILNNMRDEYNKFKIFIEKVLMNKNIDLVNNLNNNEKKRKNNILRQINNDNFASSDDMNNMYNRLIKINKKWEKVLDEMNIFKYEIYNNMIVNNNDKQFNNLKENDYYTEDIQEVVESNNKISKVMKKILPIMSYYYFLDNE